MIGSVRHGLFLVLLACLAGHGTEAESRVLLRDGPIEAHVLNGPWCSDVVHVEVRALAQPALADDASSLLRLAASLSEILPEECPDARSIRLLGVFGGVPVWSATASVPDGHVVVGPPPRPEDRVPVDERTRVQATQVALDALGYDVGEVDGLMGPRTREAILAFERSHGLAATGEPSADVFIALMRASRSDPSDLAGAEGAAHGLGTTAGPPLSAPADGFAAEFPLLQHSDIIAGPLEGLPIWNGRIIVAGSADIPDLPPLSAVTQMGDLATLLALRHSPNLIEDDVLAFAFLQLLDEPTQEEIVASAGVDPEGVVGIPRYWRDLDEFDRRALLQRIRSVAVPNLFRRTPALPIPVLVICSATFSSYDFDQERFPIQTERGRFCNSIQLGIGDDGKADLGNLRRLTVSAPLAVERLPDGAPVPLTQAEDYRQRNLGGADPRISDARAFAVAARLVGLREVPARAPRRAFEFVVDLQRVLLFRPDDLSAPFQRLSLTAPPSLTTIPSVPDGPVPLQTETVNLLLLARNVVPYGDDAFADWAASRAADEATGRAAPWARFFHEDVARRLSRRDRQVDPELLANFTEWTRARALALPVTIALTAQSATLDWLTRDSGPGTVAVFSPIDRPTSRRLADQLGVPENRLIVPKGFVYSDPQHFAGLGRANVVLVLPRSRDDYTVPIDTTVDLGWEFLDVSAELLLQHVRIDRPPDGQPTVVIDVVPVSARVVVQGQDAVEIGSVGFAG